MHKRAIVHQFGVASEVVRLERHRPGPLAPDSVRIRMTSRSINPSDLITISGAYDSRTPLPFIPGFEGVGVVEAVGHEVRGLRTGARVVPIGAAGAWQDLKDCPGPWCLSVPSGVTDAQAAMSYVNPMTAWAMVHDVARVRPGMRIAVTAAGSAIGRMIIALVNQIGVAPIAFVRSERAAQNLAGLSADIVRYTDLDGSGSLDERRPASGTVDVMLDCVGGADALVLSRCLRPRGTFVHYGLLSGDPIPSGFWSARPDIDYVMFHLRNWVRAVPLDEVHRTYAKVASLMADGIIQTSVRAAYPLRQVTDALKDARLASASGKVLITE